MTGHPRASPLFANFHLVVFIVTAGCCDCDCPSKPCEASTDVQPIRGGSADVAPCVPPGEEMVLVPEGPFWMGCNAALDEICSRPGRDGRAEELPYHEVYLSAYYIDRHEVTISVMVDFLNENGGLCSGYPCWESKFDDTVAPWNIRLNDGRYQVPEGYEDYPAFAITWYGADAACEWQGKRLCTEAEWEKAARGTDGRIFPWGNMKPDATRDVLCTIVEPSGLECPPEPVGTKPAGASPYGVENLMGNAFEWVSDWWNYWYYPVSPYENPHGPTSGNKKVIRGQGAGTIISSEAIGTSRRFPSDYYFDLALPAQGFRCCRDACPASN